jgi:hypothetical protein
MEGAGRRFPAPSKLAPPAARRHGHFFRGDTPHSAEFFQGASPGIGGTVLHRRQGEPSEGGASAGARPPRP